MRTADNGTHFELGLLGPYTPISVEVCLKNFAVEKSLIVGLSMVGLLRRGHGLGRFWKMSRWYRMVVTARVVNKLRGKETERVK